jgi:hypothetical protein
MANVDPMDGKAQAGFHNESRVDNARVHTRWLAKANRLMCWIGLLFGKVESVSGTNKVEGSEKVTKGGVNGSQSKFLSGTWPISQIEPDNPLF